MIVSSVMRVVLINTVWLFDDLFSQLQKEETTHLRSLASNATSQLDVLRHDGHDELRISFSSIRGGAKHFSELGISTKKLKTVASVALN